MIEDRPLGFGFSLLRDQVLRVPLFFIADSPWAAFDKQNHTHGVHAGATPGRARRRHEAESYCTCLFDHISERVPYDIFASVTSSGPRSRARPP